MSSTILFDSHLHLTAARFDEDRAEVLARARASGVREMVTIASDPADARAAIALAVSEPGISATVGLHPHEAARTSEPLLEDVASLADHEAVVAVGETGLDFHYDHAPREIQIENFRAHLELAARTRLPIVVHSRSAERETTDLVREFGDRVTGVLHCFSGGGTLLEAALDAGWYVSFSGLVTFVPDLEGPARRVSDDRILIETDAPYLAPAPKRGRRNEPAFLTHTCARLADLRAVRPERMAELTTANARRFYRLAGAT